jgi:hypothetical protein
MRKTVYGKIFRKPFSFQNTREALLCSLSLFSFSFSASSLCLCSLLSASALCPATLSHPSHPDKIWAGRPRSFRARPAARSDSRTWVRAISSLRVSFNRISRGRRRWRRGSVGLGFAEQNEDCGFGVLFPVGNGLFAVGQGCGFLFQWVTGCCLGLYSRWVAVVICWWATGCCGGSPTVSADLQSPSIFFFFFFIFV